MGEWTASFVEPVPLNLQIVFVVTTFNNVVACDMVCLDRHSGGVVNEPRGLRILVWLLLCIFLCLGAFDVWSCVRFGSGFVDHGMEAHGG